MVLPPAEAGIALRRLATRRIHKTILTESRDVSWLSKSHPGLSRPMIQTSRQPRDQVPARLVSYPSLQMGMHLT
jgi:hypothetical protein